VDPLRSTKANISSCSGPRPAQVRWLWLGREPPWLAPLYRAHSGHDCFDRGGRRRARDRSSFPIADSMRTIRQGTPPPLRSWSIFDQVETGSRTAGSCRSCPGRHVPGETGSVIAPSLMACTPSSFPNSRNRPIHWPPSDGTHNAYHPLHPTSIEQNTTP